MKCPLRQERGFSLIELTVVIVIIGLTMAITMPRFRSGLLSDHLKASTRRVAILITSLSKKAVREHKDYLLYFDFAENRYWTENSGLTEEGRLIAREQAVNLPENVRLLDIMKKGDEIRTTGEVSLMITKKGYLQPATIHLGSDQGRVFTIYLKTFAGKAEILDGYVEIEE